MKERRILSKQCLANRARGLLAGIAIVCGAMVPAESALAQDAGTNAPHWDSSIGLGLTLTRGNSRTVLVNANLQSQRKTPDNEIILGADATYGEDNSVKNTETLHGSAQYNHLLSKRFYWGVKLDAIHDGVARVDYRLTLAPLAGYYFIKTKDTFLAGEAGPAVVYQRQGGISRGYVTLRLGERFEHKFSAKARLWQTFEILPQVDKFENYYMNAEIGVDAAITKTVSLRTYVQDTYYNIPASGRQKNDVKLVAGVAYKF